MTYADDLVILCRRGKAEEALRQLREIMGKLKLTVNEEKTRICKMPEGAVRLLGLHVRTDVLAENRQSLSGLPAIEEEHQTHGRENPCDDRPVDLGKRPQSWWSVEPGAARMGELLSGRHRHTRRTGRSTITQRCGCAGGCAASTKSGGAGAGPIHSRTSTGTSGSFA